jgi:hypothetical protein
MTANEQADKILIESLYKKISTLQIDVENQRKYIDRLKAENRHIAFKKIHDLIHPDTTPQGDEYSDGEVLDMIFDIVKERVGK